MMPADASSLVCPACAAAVPLTHPYSWCSVCGVPLPEEITARLDNPYTRPGHPLAVTLREDTGPDHEQVRQAIAALLEPPRPTVAALVLTLSIVAFAGASLMSGNSLVGVASLLGLLFVHESGHYLAMRAFGYQNVRMFFVPFLGAAVSSPTSGVAAWKEGVVLLAGPVPGIVLGAGLFVLAGVIEARWLATVANVAFSLNLFNLLPLGPLDGGQLFRLTVFGRSRWLEAAFQLVTGAALAWLALSSGAMLLAGLAVVMATTVRYRLRQRKVARQLLTDHPGMPRDLGALSDDQQRLLYGYALEALPDPSKKTAEQVAGAMRSLLSDITPAPGWLASGGLLLAWLVAAMIGLVGVGATSLPPAVWAERRCPNFALSTVFPAEPASYIQTSEPGAEQRTVKGCYASAEGTGMYVAWQMDFGHVLDRAERRARFPVLDSPNAVDQRENGRDTTRVEDAEKHVWTRFIFDGPVVYELTAEGGDQLHARQFLHAVKLGDAAVAATGASQGQ